MSADSPEFADISSCNGASLILPNEPAGNEGLIEDKAQKRAQGVKDDIIDIDRPRIAQEPEHELKQFNTHRQTNREQQYPLKQMKASADKRRQDSQRQKQRDIAERVNYTERFEIFIS